MENWIEVITLFVATSIMMGAMFKFMWNRLDKKFDAIDKRFEKIDKRFEKMEQILESMNEKMHSMDKRLSRLENQEEERFRNEIKLLVKERNEGH